MHQFPLAADAGLNNAITSTTIYCYKAHYVAHWRFLCPILIIQIIRTKNDGFYNCEYGSLVMISWQGAVISNLIFEIDDGCVWSGIIIYLENSRSTYQLANVFTLST